MKTFKDFKDQADRMKNTVEDEGGVPTNNAGSGNISGIGVGPAGEPGVSPNYQKKRKQLKLMNGPAVDPRMFADKIFAHSKTAPQPKKEPEIMEALKVKTSDCHICDCPTHPDNLSPARMYGGKVEKVCTDCRRNGDWNRCEKCSHLYEPDDEGNICKHCKGITEAETGGHTGMFPWTYDKHSEIEVHVPKKPNKEQNQHISDFAVKKGVHVSVRHEKTRNLYGVANPSGSWSC